jgi:hypothetical protein
MNISSRDLACVCRVAAKDRMATKLNLSNLQHATFMYGFSDHLISAAQERCLSTQLFLRNAESNEISFHSSRRVPGNNGRDWSLFITC